MLKVRIAEWGWTRRKVAVQSIDLHHATRGAIMAATTDESPPREGENLAPYSADRSAVIAARIQNAVEIAMGAVERVLGKIDPANGAEAERDGRTLASVSCTLRELAMHTRPPEASVSNDDDAPVPRGVDEFRYELARRIHAFIAARDARLGGVPAEPKAELD